MTYLIAAPDDPAPAQWLHRCPGCRAQLLLTTLAEGTPLCCPKCGARFTIAPHVKEVDRIEDTP